MLILVFFTVSVGWESEQDSTSYSGPGSLAWFKSDNSWSWKGAGLASWGLVESLSLHAVSEPPQWSSHSGSFGFFHEVVTLGLVRPLPWPFRIPVWVIQPAKWKIWHVLWPSLRSHVPFTYITVTSLPRFKERKRNPISWWKEGQSHIVKRVIGDTGIAIFGKYNLLHSTLRP